LASESNAEPVDGTLYSADAKFGSGTGPSSTIFALAKGDINNVTVTNLTRGTTYVATAYEYNENIAGTKTDYNPTGAQVQFTTLKDQAITVTNPGAKAMGETPFAITASSTSGLPIAFTAVTANVVIDAGKVVLRAPGPAKVKSSQPGNEDYSPAEDVEITFCVNPPQPAIVIQKPDGKYLLTSSSETNNQWLLNGTEIAGATGNTLEPPVDGVYSVKVDFSGCSATSVPTSNLITGIEDVDQNVVVHPNPAKEVVIIQTGPFAIKSTDVLFTDATGRQHFFNGRQEGNNRLAVNVASTLIRGLYVIEVQTNIGAVRKKIMID
ncbi:MAG TPA: T9SS type A sorting domain-containing protein, partial [Cyclobacteriaceae bacterium]|nr:T9SS type A sorting domain-containing protein [Cyclobacteriaceae bacterium]